MKKEIIITVKLKTKCGRTISSNGKPFTAQSLAQHEKDCKACAYHLRAMAWDQEISDVENDIDPFDIIDDDMPDGAYWAMHNEIYGWP